MVGFPYDDVDAWRAIYPAEVFVAQLEKVASGFDQAIAKLKPLASNSKLKLKPSERHHLAREIDVAEAATLHFRSVANQARFVLARRALAGSKDAAQATL